MTVRNHSLATLGAAILCAALVTGSASKSHAQSIPPDFKGIVGLGLIGAELGLVTPAIAGLRAPWAYAVFPAVGAIGGGLAGYFLLESPGHTNTSIAMLGVGMALVIPATLLTLQLTAYDPEDEVAPVAQTARFDLRRAREAQARVRAGSGLVRVAEGGVWIGPPAVGPVASSSQAGMRFGASDFQLSLVSGSF